MPNPVLVELTRGEWLESRHRGSIAVADAKGALVWSAGDVDQPVFGRSSLKMLQALPLVETGAADAFAVSDAELALACASHSGEPVHVEAVGGWLGRIGCDETCLACGAHPPLNEAAARALVLEGKAPSRLHNNCSGKHAGFLTVARHLGVDIAGYERPDHLVQRRALAAMAEMAGVDPASMRVAIDGCAAPAPAFPLRGLATAMARIANPSGLAPDRAEAACRLDAAVKAHPLMVAGTGRACTAIIRAAGGRASVKTGAEGVFVAVLADLGLGIALKIDDGAGRASETTIAALLAALGVVSADDPAISSLIDAPVLNTQRPAAWLAAALREAVAAARPA
ncbi:MAG: asparaginase [Caulobacteraceae bacterium]|nr:asparaginase [Caulobacteraceae bacterium]